MEIKLRVSQFTSDSWMKRISLLLFLGKSHLVQVQWIHVQSIKSIGRRALALPPFLHLCRAEVMGSVNVTSPPFASLESFEDSTLSLGFLVLEESLAVR